MKKTLFTLALIGSAAAASAQFQFNPQAGLTFQTLTKVETGTKTKAALGWTLGADFRIGLPERLAPLTDQEQRICQILGPELVDLGLLLVGLDVIDDLLIEVNVTSSGALHKADRLLGTTLCHDLIRQLELLQAARRPG